MTRKGRPSLITQQKVDVIVAAVTRGNFLETACRLAGVRQELYHRWRSEGEKLLLKIEKGVDPSTFSEEQLLYLDLATRILTAEAQVEDTLATSWQGAALDDWKAAKEFLARRFPNTWGRDPNLLTEEGEVRLGVLHVSIARRPSEPAPEA